MKVKQMRVLKYVKFGPVFIGWNGAIYKLVIEFGKTVSICIWETKWE